MVYIDGSGQVTNAPLTYKITEFFKNFYFALVLFISTLFYVSSLCIFLQKIIIADYWFIYIANNYS